MTHPSMIDPKKVDPEAFAHFLETHEDGALVPDLSRAYAQLVAAVAEHQKKGTLTLKLSMGPSEFGHPGELLDVGVEIIEKPPTPTRLKGAYYVLPDGDLSTDNPSQHPLPYPEDTTTEEQT